MHFLRFLPRIRFICKRSAEIELMQFGFGFSSVSVRIRCICYPQGYILGPICFWYLRNEFDFWKVQGIMITSGLLHFAKEPKYS